MKDQVISHFQTVDPIMYSLAITYGTDVVVGSSANHFSDLCEAIVCQQLSAKAGSTIWNRFVSIFVNPLITPEIVITIPDETIRSVGLSNQKTGYIKNIARGFLDGTVQPVLFPTMLDEDIIEHLIRIKGVGRWTAEMFCMFSLGREDIFSFGDLGLKKAMEKHYGDIDKQTLVSRWSPYRTYAARILWNSLDNTK